MQELKLWSVPEFYLVYPCLRFSINLETKFHPYGLKLQHPFYPELT